MSNPIPVKNREGFILYMANMERMKGDDEWALLDAAEEYMIAKKFQRGNPQDALNYYTRLRNLNTQQGESI